MKEKPVVVAERLKKLREGVKPNSPYAWRESTNRRFSVTKTLCLFRLTVCLCNMLISSTCRSIIFSEGLTIRRGSYTTISQRS